MKICPYCRSPNHDSYTQCSRCRRLSPREEQRRRYSGMLLPSKEKLEFVPAGTPPQAAHAPRADAAVSGPAAAQPPAQGAQRPHAPASMMRPLSVAPAKKPAAPAPGPPEQLPSTSQECTELGMKYYNAGAYDRAEVLFRRSLELNPGDVNVWMLRGVSLRCLRKVDEALACFDKAIELKPDCIEAWRRKGFTLRILNRTEEAIKCYDKIVELNPRDTAALNDKANALDDLRRHEEALKVYEMVLKINPKDRYALENKEATERIIKRKAAEAYRASFFGPKPI